MLRLGLVVIPGAGNMRSEADAARIMRENRIVGGETPRNGSTTPPGGDFELGFYGGIPSVPTVNTPPRKFTTSKRLPIFRSCGS
jgi:hypothetical protein